MNEEIQHHAILLQASSLEDSLLPTRFMTQDADVQHLVSDTFGIDEARELTEQASRKAVTEEGRTFVICTNSITLQAQNALLKLFEEPPAGVRFYLLLPNTEVIIPTLRSRLYVLQTETKTENSGVLKELTALSYGDRIGQIASKTKEKDQQWINAIVSEALHLAEESGDKDLLEGVIFVASHINGAGSSKKMLLEELVLTLS